MKSLAAALVFSIVVPAAGMAADFPAERIVAMASGDWNKDGTADLAVIATPGDDSGDDNGIYVYLAKPDENRLTPALSLPNAIWGNLTMFGQEPELAALANGQVFHEAIAAAEPYAHENALGWAGHYAVGILYGIVFALIVGIGWFSAPSFLPAWIFSILTIAAGWFLMQPGMGLGWAEAQELIRRAQAEARTRDDSLIAYGAGTDHLAPGPMSLSTTSSGPMRSRWGSWRARVAALS